MENTGRRSLSLLRTLVVVLAVQLATAQDPASALAPSEVKRADWSSMRGAWGKRGDLNEVELEVGNCAHFISIVLLFMIIRLNLPPCVYSPVTLFFTYQDCLRTNV